MENNKTRTAGASLLTGLDYPDPDVIRVGDTYYMASTTMHFMPGCAILRSYDLLHWELVSYVYDVLEDTPGHRLESGEHIYGKGMWAPSLRWHAGRFYVCFTSNDAHKTYLFHAPSVTGPWERQVIAGFYHDCSLLFDDDGRVYIVYGNREIWLTELRTDLTGPKEGGLHRRIVSDEGNEILGYEGSHIYKINGTYYVFFIHSRRDCWRRVEACFRADSLTGTFTGGDVLDDDQDYCGHGIAQGGIVDIPDGDWYAVLFQDHGAVGRIPVLVPVCWQDGFPVFGADGKAPEVVGTVDQRPGHVYLPLMADDDFCCAPDAAGKLRLKLPWQWNHLPDNRLWSVGGGILRITTGKVCANVCEAVNTLTQRMCFPGCEAQVTVDGSGLKEGDFAGICALQGCYGLIALTRRAGRLELVMCGRPDSDALPEEKNPGTAPGVAYARIPWDAGQAVLMVRADFRQMRDEAEFFFLQGGSWQKLGITQKLCFKMDHFCGCRAGLFCYSTKEAGGTAGFSEFRIRKA